MKIFDKFFIAATKKKTPEALIFSCHIINLVLLLLILKWYEMLKDFFQLNSVRYHDDVVMKLKSDLSNLKILMSG